MATDHSQYTLENHRLVVFDSPNEDRHLRASTARLEKYHTCQRR